jgi:hypothetical protein
MIAKFARYRAIGVGRQVPPATAARGNDYHALRRVFGDPQRTLRRVLVCHWRVRPQTGALECVWQTEVIKCSGDAAADEQPPLYRLTARTHRSRRRLVGDAFGASAAA